jgi:hypothetical protein
MFAGTYRSEFYRLVRNLLHDQLQHPNSLEVARRWEEIIADEAAYRQDVSNTRAGFDARLAGAVS